jgi:phage tail-like protein
VSMMDMAGAAQMLPRAMGSVTPGGLTPSALSAVSGFRHLGLAMRFHVQIDLGFDLGHWTSCEGLKVDFECETIHEGGDYANAHVLPKHVTYPAVTLKRAVERPYSATVQRWLSLVAEEWQKGGEPEIGATVTITLLDVYQDMENYAAQWVLANAFPKSWSGPSMIAKSLDIATETLVLEHSGFLGSAP